MVLKIAILDSLEGVVNHLHSVGSFNALQSTNKVKS